MISQFIKIRTPLRYFIISITANLMLYGGVFLILWFSMFEFSESEFLDLAGVWLPTTWLIISLGLLIALAFYGFFLLVRIETGKKFLIWAGLILNIITIISVLMAKLEPASLLL